MRAHRRPNLYLISSACSCKFAHTAFATELFMNGGVILGHKTTSRNTHDGMRCKFNATSMFGSSWREMKTDYSMKINFYADLAASPCASRIQHTCRYINWN